MYPDDYDGLDLVWFVRPGINEHLRYSIRSLTKHIPHRRVIIVGHPPSWYKGETRRPPRSRGQYGNTRRSMRIACTELDLSDPFIYCHDDMFAFEDVRAVPTAHRGPLSERVAHFDATGTKGAWADGGRATLKALRAHGISEPFDFDLHIPIHVSKRHMLEGLGIIRNMDAAYPWMRTIATNLMTDGGVRMDDVKITNNHDAGAGPWLSTAGPSWRGAAGDRVRSAFPEPSVYELHQRVQ